MKFAWDTQLTDLDNRVVNDDKGTPITLGYLVVQSLMAAGKGEVDGAAKYARYKLAQSVMADRDIDVTDAALIKKLVGEHMGPIPVGRVWDLLEHPLGS